MTAEQDRRWVALDVPPWLFGGQPSKFFPLARWKVRRSSSAEHGRTWSVITEESYLRRKPDLVRVHRLELDGDGLSPSSRTLVEKTIMPNIEDDTLAKTHTRLEAELQHPLGSPIVEAVYRANVRTISAVGAPELEHAIVDGVNSLHRLVMESGGRALAPVSVSLVTRDDAVAVRIRYLAMLLRVKAEPQVAAGDLSTIAEDIARGRPAFGSAHEQVSGAVMLDAYLGPLLAALSPSVWGSVAHRAGGAFIYAFSRPVAGSSARPNSLLGALPKPGVTKSFQSLPFDEPRAGGAAVDWWVGALNDLFGWLTDPARFADADGRYDPMRQLQVVASIEQVFRRMLSVQTQHGDPTSRTVLMFSLLDTLESILRIRRTVLLSRRHARETLARLEAVIVGGAAEVLLPAARRAVDALSEVGSAFMMLDDDGRVPLGQGQKSASIEDAIPRYLNLRRNAVHGFGSDRASQREIDASLMARHTGELPHDLALLPWLYMLDVLASPERMAKLQ